MTEVEKFVPPSKEVHWRIASGGNVVYAKAQTAYFARERGARMMGKHPTVCEVELAYLPHKTTVLDYLLWLCADRFGFTPEKLKEQNRKKQLSKARKLFCWAAVCYTEFSLPEIGDFLDRDHSSVQKAAMKVGKEASFREDMKWLEGEL